MVTLLPTKLFYSLSHLDLTRFRIKNIMWVDMPFHRVSECVYDFLPNDLKICFQKQYSLMKHDFKISQTIIFTIKVCVSPQQVCY